MVLMHRPLLDAGSQWTGHDGIRDDSKYRDRHRDVVRCWVQYLQTRWRSSCRFPFVPNLLFHVTMEVPLLCKEWQTCFARFWNQRTKCDHHKRQFRSSHWKTSFRSPMSCALECLMCSVDLLRWSSWWSVHSSCMLMSAPQTGDASMKYDNVIVKLCNEQCSVSMHKIDCGRQAMSSECQNC